MFDIVPKRGFFPTTRDWDVDSLFNDAFLHFFGYSGYEDKEGNLIYELEVPGFNKDNLSVEVSDGILTINGEKEVKDKNSICKSKVFKQLNVGQIDDVTADLKDGLLTLTLKNKETETKKIIIE